MQDLDHVVRGELPVAVAAEIGELRDARKAALRHAESAQRRRGAELFMEEFLQCGDTLFRLLALALPGGIDAPDVPGEAGKARRGALADILEIRQSS